MIILDTNVVSEPSKLRANPNVLAWFDHQAQSSLFLTAISVAELKAGVALLPEGKRKESLQKIFEGILKNFATSILPFDREAAFVYDAVVSLIILFLIKMFVGLRVSTEIEREGLDLALHGEVVQ